MTIVNRVVQTIVILQSQCNPCCFAQHNATANATLPRTVNALSLNGCAPVHSRWTMLIEVAPKLANTPEKKEVLFIANERKRCERRCCVFFPRDNKPPSIDLRNGIPSCQCTFDATFKACTPLFGCVEQLTAVESDMRALLPMEIGHGRCGAALTQNSIMDLVDQCRTRQWVMTGARPQKMN